MHWRLPAVRATAKPEHGILIDRDRVVHVVLQLGAEIEFTIGDLAVGRAHLQARREILAFAFTAADEQARSHGDRRADQADDDVGRIGIAPHDLAGQRVNTQHFAGAVRRHDHLRNSVDFLVGERGRSTKLVLLVRFCHRRPFERAGSFVERHEHDSLRIVRRDVQRVSHDQRRRGLGGPERLVRTPQFRAVGLETDDGTPHLPHVLFEDVVRNDVQAILVDHRRCDRSPGEMAIGLRQQQVLPARGAGRGIQADCVLLVVGLGQRVG